MGSVNSHFYHAENGRVLRIIEPFKSLNALPVKCYRVLREIVRADGEEAYFLCKLGGDHHGCGRFDHNAQLNAAVKGYALLFQLRHYSAAKPFCLLNLPKARYHREHYRKLSVCGRAVERSQLSFDRFTI